MLFGARLCGKGDSNSQDSEEPSWFEQDLYADSKHSRVVGAGRIELPSLSYQGSVRTFERYARIERLEVAVWDRKIEFLYLPCQSSVYAS